MTDNAPVSCNATLVDTSILTKAYDASESYLSKISVKSHFQKKTFRSGIHTWASFYFRESTFTIGTSSILDSFLLHMESWYASQKHVMLLTRVSWSLYCVWQLKVWLILV